MEKERPDEQQNGGEVVDTAPAVVLPSPNIVGVNGNLQGFPSTISPVAPQPLLSPDTGGSDGLATQVEDALAEDGRFTALVPGLHIDASDGTVHLSGPVPSEGQRQSLLAAVRAVSGVREITDDLRIE